MKRIATLLALILGTTLSAQVGNSTCANAIQICLTQPVTYPAATNAGAAEAGPDYSCLGSQNNPAWFLFRIGTPGTHTILESNSNARDLDYILFGPFTNPTGNCDSLNANHTAACSYAGGATETINFTSTTAGDYYLLLITNYSNLATNVTFTQTAGTGDYDCEFEAVCAVSLLTGTPSGCDTLTNQFSISGSVYTFNPPPSGTLTVTYGSVVQTLNAPFSNPVNFNLTGLPSNGTTNTLSASFSAEVTCTASIQVQAPAGCLPCDVTIESNSPICEGGDLNFITTFAGNATYQWSGPNTYASTSMNPTIEAIAANQAGTYTVLVTGQNCVATRDITVDVIASQKPVAVNVGNEICEGEILFLSALEVPGGIFSWTGPNGFTANGRNAQVNNASPAATGNYYVGMSINNCANRYDTLSALVHPRPVISIHGDSVQTPNSTSILYVDGADGLYYYWNYTGSTTLLNNGIYTSDRDTVVAFWNNYEGFISAEVIAEDSNGCQSLPARLDIHVTNGVGIHNVNDLVGLQLFPNPANEQFNLRNNSATAAQLRITDASGKAITSLQVPAGETKSLSLSTWPAGVYFVHSGNRHIPLMVVH